MSVNDSVGSTPLVKITNLNPNPRVELYAKLEGSNPGGSVKDRIALRMIEDAEADGRLTRDKIVLEATSGNTGIGLAMVCAAKGYRVKLTMPACVSVERRRVLEAFGAELILSPAEQGTDGAIRMAHSILAEDRDRYFMPNQFDNPSNWKAHYDGTGPELLRQTGGRLTHFVAGMGTSGTLMGVSRYMKEAKPDVTILGVEPVLGHKVQGLKNMKESIVPGIFEPGRLDERVIVNDSDAFATARMMAVKEGIFAGMSSGAAMKAAIDLCSRLDSGVVAVIVPDRGDRYLSTTLFASVCGACPP